MLRLRDRLVSIEERTAVGKRIRRDVHHTHDQGALAQFERSRAQIPVEDCPHEAMILNERGDCDRGPKKQSAEVARNIGSEDAENRSSARAAPWEHRALG